MIIVKKTTLQELDRIPDKRGVRFKEEGDTVTNDVDKNYTSVQINPTTGNSCKGYVAPVYKDVGVIGVTGKITV